MTIKITFPDGNVKEFPKNTKGIDVAKSISDGLARVSICCKINGELKDMDYQIPSDAKFEILTSKTPGAIEIMRHSIAHIMAAAVIKLFPDAKPTIGPAIEDGFYYDFDAKPFTPDDLIKIESEMNNIIKEKLTFSRKEISHSEAKSEFKTNPYKLELIEDNKEKILSFYTLGPFIDLCRGPHIQNTGLVKAFKLTKVAGAYWRGDATKAQLQRIYGVAFFEKKELDEYLKMKEEAEKRDHRKLGKELDLFMMHELSPGIPFFLPNGMIMLNELIKFVREYSYGEGYKEVRTPQIYNSELWKISGHWEHYKDDMFCMHHAEDNMDVGVKPMNCPGHMLVFKRDVRSYKELPLRIAETTTLYRNEKSGTLHGLTRVRSISQDDTHIFLTQEMISSEIKILLEKIKTIYKVFDLQIDEVHLSTRPEQFLGKIETWNDAEDTLKAALSDAGLDYKINEGDGAFYGPKIDVKVKDAIGRQWQLATIQLDYQLPQRFELKYDDIDGTQKTPVVIHRAILGSMERFYGILIEHYVGKFPLWLNPRQVRILTIADRFNDYASEVAKMYKDAGLRVECDFKPETLNRKVRDAQLDQVNYIIVIGQQEVDSKKINVRTRANEVVGSVDTKEFLAKLQDEIKNKK